MTRRRFLAIFPVFLIALLVQAYAPVGSARAIGRAQQHAVIAVAAEPCPVHAHQPAAPSPHAPGGACDLCDFVFSGAAAVAFDIPQVHFHSVAPYRIAWPLPYRRIFATSRKATAQARAPPLAG